jgi:spore germination protein GerM
MVTLYFTDGNYLVPVSRRMPDSDLPDAAVRALVAGPIADSGLSSPLPSGIEVRSISISAGEAYVDFSAAFPTDDEGQETALNAVVQTLTALPGVRSVSLSVEGESLTDSEERTPLLYFASPNGLLAVPTAATDPRQALASFLEGPPRPEMGGFPPDVQLRAYEYDAAAGLLALTFSYTDSLEAFALSAPSRVRLQLLGLIASLTEFPHVRAVQLDSDGRARLGMGQCSDLIGTPIRRPALLNDERMLGRQRRQGSR